MLANEKRPLPVVRRVASSLFALLVLATFGFAAFLLREGADLPGLPRLSETRPVQIHAPGATPVCVRAPAIQPLAFDAALWKATGDEDPEHARFRMLDDLLADDRLVGAKADELEALLGPLRQGRPTGGGSLRYFYWVRPKRFFGLNALLVELGDDERVKAVRTNAERERRPLLPAAWCLRHLRFE